ncbi:kinesin motor protein cin8 [Podila epigama]|nr:kinesin motor protein cin8 [Podila epigama]
MGYSSGGGATANKELNIQVVLRCRIRNEREQKENSPVVVTAQNREIQVPSTLGDRAPSKTYTFDRVFMYADQETIYNDVVTPILDEVLMGYNCTVFAYGQTGTGKTYTMEGDLRDHYGECSPDAGIIPRTLYQLFASLERKATEYSVRISFLELYNEEVKDLLASDDDRKVVKIFDVSKKGGPLVQGLEEVAVYNATQGIEALRKGSAKRTVASTKSNDKSSRSHGVFSITVHVKETADDGEELLKIGKLNLVDLAGSENIARSGAEFNQAREAGRINQSLLTLGRVINCLVERSPHVPYRESKLTRLLEDSLGGKTKTCIIATISPARSCLEETISTLNYANRAKSIKNTPEINQKMSKKTLIKEYLLEIDRLKNDLAATREKNGVFMTKESYQTLLDESTSNKDLVTETQKQAEKALAELQRVEDKFRENLKLLTATETKLNQSIAELGVKEQELQESRDELSKTRQSLEEETILRKAHAETEKKLNSLAADLRTTLATSVKDVKGLHDKLERKSTIERENRNALTEFQEKLLQLSSALTDRIDTFGTSQSQIWDSVSRNMDEAHQDAVRGVEGIQTFLDTQLVRMAVATKEFKTQRQGTIESAEAFRREFEAVQRDTLVFLKETSATTKTAAIEGLAALKKAISEFCTAVEGHHATMTKGVVGLVDEATAFSENQAQQLLQALDDYQHATHAEVEFLVKENRKLREDLQAQQKLGASSTQQLLANIGGLLDEFLKGQSDALMGHFSRASLEQEASTQRLVKANSDQKAWVMGFNDQRQQRLNQLVDSKESFASTGQDIQQSIVQRGGALYTRTDNILAQLKEALDSQQISIQTKVDSMSSRAQDGYQRLETQHMAMADIYDQSSESTVSAFESLKARSAALKSEAETGYNRATDNIRISRQDLKTFDVDAGTNLHTTRQELEDLVPGRFKVDDSTGRTPARRHYKFPQTWPLTRPSKDILKEFRELGRVDVVCEDQTLDSDFAMDASDPNDGYNLPLSHQENSDVLSAPVLSSTSDSQQEGVKTPLIATTTTTIQDSASGVHAPFVQDDDERKSESGTLTPGALTASSKGALSSHLDSEREKENMDSIRQKAEGPASTSSIPSLFGVMTRPVRPNRAGYLLASEKTVRGEGTVVTTSDVGSILSTKRPHTEVEVDSNSDRSSSSANGSLPLGLVDISNSVLPSTATLANTGESSALPTATAHSTQKATLGATGSTATANTITSTSLPRPLSIFSFGAGKSGTTNGSEGPRKISRPVSKRPSFR